MAKIIQDRFRNLKSLKRRSDGNQDAKRLENIELDKLYTIAQPRKIFENIEELAESMKTIGQLTPITVYPDGKGKYIIEQGERRYRAAKLAGFKTITAQINSESIEVSTRIIRQLAENVARDNMKLYELVQAINNISDTGITGRELAKRLGMQESTISKLKAIATLPPILEDLLREGHFADALGLYLLNKAFGEHEEEIIAQINLWKASFQDESAFVITRAQISELLKRLNKSSQKSGESDVETKTATVTPVNEDVVEHTSVRDYVADDNDNEKESAQTREKPSLLVSNDNYDAEMDDMFAVANNTSDVQSTAVSAKSNVRIHVYALEHGQGYIPLDKVPPTGMVYVTLPSGETVECKPFQIRIKCVEAL